MRGEKEDDTHIYPSAVLPVNWHRHYSGEEVRVEVLQSSYSFARFLHFLPGVAASLFSMRISDERCGEHKALQAYAPILRLLPPRCESSFHQYPQVQSLLLPGEDHPEGAD